MDLLQTVRKEGSRGGVNFSWDDVKSSNHRENYLGHSLMAPVGRWQKGKDLNWYAKAEDADLTPEERAEKARLERQDELRRVKEAEEDAMARALGLPVPDRSNANLEPVAEGRATLKDVETAVKETLDDGDRVEEKRAHRPHDRSERRHRRERSRSRDRRRRTEHRDRDDRRHRRSRSRSRDRDAGRDRHHRRRRSRSRSPARRDERRDRSRERPPRSPHGDRRRSRSRERQSRRHRSTSRSPFARERRDRDDR